MAGTCAAVFDADHVRLGGVLGPPVSAVPSNLPCRGDSKLLRGLENEMAVAFSLSTANTMTMTGNM